MLVGYGFSVGMNVGVTSIMGVGVKMEFFLFQANDGPDS